MCAACAAEMGLLGVTVCPFWQDPEDKWGEGEAQEELVPQLQGLTL